MGESSGSVSIDMERISLGGKEHIVQTCCGSISVVVYGDQDKPALITYPDVALNRKLHYLKVLKTCHVSRCCSFVQKFRPCYSITFASTTLVHRVMRSVILPIWLQILTWLNLVLVEYCVNDMLSWNFAQEFLQLGAAPICSDSPVPSVDDLADQVADVLDFFGLDAVMCLGVTAGAYVLTLFAMRYRERVLGLMLVSPLCKAPSWTEWLYNKVMANLVYFYGMCGLVKDCLLQRYFSRDARIPESNLVKACRSLLDGRHSGNVWRFLRSINERHDLTEGLKKLRCRTLIFVGENSPFHSESLHMTSKLDRRYSALVEVQACGSLVTEEQADAMLVPMEYFLMGYGLYRPARVSGSPRSPLSPSCISPELLSPESMGLKLKPIKTRVSLQV
ncbi:hypothetical protein Taro_043860 [Colocasia esculenta]|uniref:Pollen-specific protein SF21 n=1 Tax=Colocasia esculenta TaxID=4460 RepID=A0A843WHJ3_COLES|nr:hypothetical protein [Colocasia esculenta]